MRRPLKERRRRGTSLPKGFEQRARERRKKMVGNIARNWKEAEEWDLEFWQSQTPAMRIRAVEELRQEWRAIEYARRHAGH